MYTNNKDIYHFLLDLKLGLPVAIKTDFGNYILLTSSDSVTNETLELMKNVSASKISIIINKKRMNYLSKKDIDGELFSISFIEEMDCHLAQDISGSILNNKKSLLEKASISLEKKPELINLVQLMKNNQIIPSLVCCNIVVDQNKKYNSELNNYNIRTYENKDILNALRETSIFNIISRAFVPISACKETEVVSFRSKNDYSEYFAIILKNADQKINPLVRIHSQCITGDILDSLKCDCGSQLKRSIEMMAENGGVLLYMPEEGRNIGLLNKLRAYEFQFHGLDTIDANYALGFDADQRRYENACELLKLLEIKSIKLITNNPEKISQIKELGINVVENYQLKVKVSIEAKNYMETKKIRSGHNL